MTAAATYTKLKDGSWGLRVAGKAFDGQDVLVVTRDGRRVEENVGKVLWTDGKISICRTFAAKARGARRHERACRDCGQTLEACERGLVCQDCQATGGAN